MKDTQILDYIKKSFELKNQGFYKPAIEMLFKALALDNENLEILVQLAYLYRLLDNFERAVYYVEKVLEISPKHIDCMLLLEEIYLIQGELKSAFEVSEKLYEIQPTQQNLAKKINVLNRLQDFDKVKEIEKSLSEFNDEVLYEIACAYHAVLDLKKAVQLLELGYAKNKKNYKIVLLLAKIYYELNEFAKSKEMFLGLKKENVTPEVLNYLGLFELNDKNLTKAAEYFSKALKQDAKNAEYSYNLASAYFLNGWLDEALKYFNQSVSLDPENIDYHYSLAYLYYQKKMYDKASFELDFINTIEQHHSMTNVLRAMITAKKGDLQTAKKQLEKVVNNDPNDDFAYSSLGQIYKELKQLDLAKEAINKAIELKPTSLDYLSELAAIELEQKNLDKAQEVAEKITQLNEKYIYAHILIAKIGLEQKDFDKVYDSAQEIIELDSNCPEGYYYNALALFIQGDTNFAIESLKKSISLDLNNASLYIKMSEFYQDLGDLKNAYDWAKEAAEIDERNYEYKWLCAKISAALKNEENAIKFYSQSYRLASFDRSLCEDYANYLKSVGKEKQADKILK